MTMEDNSRIELLEMKVNSMGEEIKTLKTDMETSKINLNEMKSDIKIMANDVGNVRDVLYELKSDVKDIKNKPSDLYDKVKVSIITSIATAVILAVLGLVMIK